MADIHHHFPIKSSKERVFNAVSEPKDLDVWWTKSSSGKPVQNAEYELGFGPGYDWRAVVSKCNPNTEFELELTKAHEDWQGARIGFHLMEKEDLTEVKSHHQGWPEDNEHYRTSCYCWAMYLRLLKRYVEYGEVVSYEDSLEV